MSVLDIPKSLKRYEKELLATEQGSLKVLFKDEAVKITGSKIGGQPYWLKNETYPQTVSGKSLRFLAQVNFSEIKQPLPDYPTSGLLQFFILDDDLYGLNFDNQTEQNTFRVVYHETIETNSSKWETKFPTINEQNYFPIEKELRMSFESQKELISLYDYRFYRMTNIEALLDNGQYDEYDEIAESYDEMNNFATGSKLGGYPIFTQDDPRFKKEFQIYDTLLFQIDSHFKSGIMWGDCGVANFFITRENLRNRNFTDVLYNWDCH